MTAALPADIRKLNTQIERLTESAERLHEVDLDHTGFAYLYQNRARMLNALDVIFQNYRWKTWKTEDEAFGSSLPADSKQPLLNRLWKTMVRHYQITPAREILKQSFGLSEGEARDLTKGWQRAHIRMSNAEVEPQLASWQECADAGYLVTARVRYGQTLPADTSNSSKFHASIKAVDAYLHEKDTSWDRAFPSSTFTQGAVAPPSTES